MEVLHFTNCFTGELRLASSSCVHLPPIVLEESSVMSGTSFTSQMPFLSLNWQCQCTEGRHRAPSLMREIVHCPRPIHSPRDFCGCVVDHLMLDL